MIFSSLTSNIVNKTFQIYDFVVVFNRVWSTKFFQTTFIVYCIIENSLRSTRFRRFLKIKRVERVDFKQSNDWQSINWSTKWTNYFDFFIIAIRNFCEMINEYRNIDYYRRYAQISSLSNNNFYFIEEFSIKTKRNFDFNVSRFLRKNRFLKKFDDAIIAFNSRKNTSSKSSFFFIIDSNNVVKRLINFNEKININKKTISFTFVSTFRRVINDTFVEKTIHHTSIELKLSFDNMKNRLNSIVQVIVNRVIQTTLHVYIVNLLTSQREKRNERDERDQFEKSKKSKTTKFDDNDNVDNKWNVVDLDFFDFFYDEKSFVFDVFFVKHVEKKFYFRDVHTFIDKITKLIVIKKAKTIRENLWLNFRDTTLKWWNIELFVNDKRMFRMSKKNTISSISMNE